MVNKSEDRITCVECKKSVPKSESTHCEECTGTFCKTHADPSDHRCKEDLENTTICDECGEEMDIGGICEYCGNDPDNPDEE